MNLANVATLSRIALTPVFALLMAADRPATTWLAFATFCVAAATDSVDGRLARSRGSTGPGAFLDLLADKILIGVALVVLALLRGFPWWAVAVLLSREAVVSGLRMRVVRLGKKLGANMLGKAKTVVQLAMVLLWILPRSGTLRVAQDASLVASVVLAVVSACVYAIHARQSSSSAVAP